MAEVIIPPASAGTTGFITGDHHDNHHHGHHGDKDWPSRTAERIKDYVADFERSHSEQTRDILSAISGGDAGISLAVEKTGAAGLLATNVAAGALGVALEKTSAAALLATNISSQQVQNTLLGQFNQTNVQSLTFFNALNVQAEKNAAAITLGQEKFAAAAELSAQRNAAAAQLLAVQNQAEALRQAAECCCELKALIKDENEKTRDLINANTVQHLRDVIAATQRLIPGPIPSPFPSPIPV